MASSSNVSVCISKPVSNLKCPALPTNDTRGRDTEFTNPRNTPVLPNPFVDCPILKNGLAAFALINNWSFVPNDILASVDDNLNPLEVMLTSVTSISTSEPRIVNEPFSNFKKPSSSPTRKFPPPSINTPLPVLMDIKPISGPNLNVGVPAPSIVKVVPKLIDASVDEI